MILIIISLFWAVCGVLFYGFVKGFFINEDRSWERSDECHAIFFAIVCGPLALVALLLELGKSGFKHFRFRKPKGRKS